jgi:hypothetical protein
MKKSIVTVAILLGGIHVSAEVLTVDSVALETSKINCVVATAPNAEGKPGPSVAAITAKSMSEGIRMTAKVAKALVKLDLFESSEITCAEIVKIKFISRMHFGYLFASVKINLGPISRIDAKTCSQQVQSTMTVAMPMPAFTEGDRTEPLVLSSSSWVYFKCSQISSTKEVTNE